jgi:hypothetical protein
LLNLLTLEGYISDILSIGAALEALEDDAQDRRVLRAIQSTSRNVQAKNGNTPYNVSLTECE